jgi:hypothetical protein
VLKRKELDRRQTIDMMQKIRMDLNGLLKKLPDPEMVWQSVRSQDISRAQQTFKWQTIHGSYKLGLYWDKIPNYEEQANCPVCGKKENIEHILLKCMSATRKAIKEAERDLWQVCTNATFPAENLSTRLGAGLVRFQPKKGLRGIQGLERFWWILQSETDQMIWLLRCKARIARGDRPEERHSIPKALNRWRGAIERRLNLERITADNK